MKHAFFIITCYVITILVLGGLSLSAYLRLRRDKNILEHLPSTRK